MKPDLALFEFFREIAIIQQLSSTLLSQNLPGGLHSSHFGVISHLINVGEGRTPAAIASAFQVTKATMTNTLTKLSAAGYIKLEPNPEDGRSKLVYLTEAGRQFHGNAIGSLGPMMAKLQADLDVSALLAMLPKLQELRRYLDAARD